jgi:hypothetical protein
MCQGVAAEVIERLPEIDCRRVRVETVDQLLEQFPRGNKLLAEMLQLANRLEEGSRNTADDTT